MPYSKHGILFFTINDLRPIVKGGGIIDCTSGGLILGNSHSDGGIYVVRQHEDQELYKVVAEVEGFEYIMHPLATANHKSHLTKINIEFKNVPELEFNEYKIPENITILDTRPILKSFKASNKLLIIGGYEQFVINKHSTKKYLFELEELNKKYCK